MNFISEDEDPNSIAYELMNLCPTCGKTETLLCVPTSVFRDGVYINRVIIECVDCGTFWESQIKKE